MADRIDEAWGRVNASESVSVDFNGAVLHLLTAIAITLIDLALTEREWLIVEQARLEREAHGG